MKTIGNLMVDDTDLPNRYNFYEAQEQVELLNSDNHKGFSDWRVPTQKELNILYKNKNKIGGFSSSYYWSSSEYDAYLAWIQYFSNGYQFYYYKSNYNYVRCVRSI